MTTILLNAVFNPPLEIGAMPLPWHSVFIRSCVNIVQMNWQTCVQKVFVVLRGLLFVFKATETKRFVLLYFSLSYQGGWWWWSLCHSAIFVDDLTQSINGYIRILLGHVGSVHHSASIVLFCRNFLWVSRQNQNTKWYYRPSYAVGI